MNREEQDTANGAQSVGNLSTFEEDKDSDAAAQTQPQSNSDTKMLEENAFSLFLTYDQFRPCLKDLKRKAITQFINRVKQTHKFCYWDMLGKEPENYADKIVPVVWGDEIESSIVIIDDENRRAVVAPYFKKFSKEDWPRMRERLTNALEACAHGESQPRVDRDAVQRVLLPQFQWQAEYTSHQVEMVPDYPYFSVGDFSATIENVRARHAFVNRTLPASCHLLQTPTFGMLGAPHARFHAPFESKYQSQYLVKQDAQNNDDAKQSSTTIVTQLSPSHSSQAFRNLYTHSIFLDDRIVNCHPRYIFASINMVQSRGGEKCHVVVPLYQDAKTDMKVQSDAEPYAGHVYMDAQAFGGACCAMQATFSALDMDHARLLYDQLAVVAPLFLAATAGSPIFKGKLVDTDSRWCVWSQAVDSRSRQERDDKNASTYIPKSRCASISRFIGNNGMHLPQYNDMPLPVDAELSDFIDQQCASIGFPLDDALKKHLLFLMLQGPLLVLRQWEQSDAQTLTDVLDVFVNTNWNTVRLKLPSDPARKEIGWRVEFRPMDTLLTHDENVAFMILTSLFVRMLFSRDFGLNLYMPISLIDENMVRAQKRDAVRAQKFFFRTNLRDSGEAQIAELTLHEIFFGCAEKNFAGVAAVWHDFVAHVAQRDPAAHDLLANSQHIRAVFDYVFALTNTDAAAGKTRLTLAQWVRAFVLQHTDYKQDSVVSERTAYDLYKRLAQITEGRVQEDNFWPLFAGGSAQDLQTTEQLAENLAKQLLGPEFRFKQDAQELIDRDVVERLNFENLKKTEEQQNTQAAQ